MKDMAIITAIVVMGSVALIAGMVEGSKALAHRSKEKRMDQAAVALLQRRSERRLIYAED